MRALFFLLFTCAFIITITTSQSRLILPRPKPLSSSPLKIIKTQKDVKAGTCSFTVVIRTSCYSTRFTRDRISIAFGDAYGNQVYAPRLDDPYSRTFEACSSDTFTLYGPCTYQICYLYLYRSGYDGWIPYDVTVYGYNTRPVSFYYNVGIPSGIWYGFNYCYGTTTTTRAASLAVM